MKREPKEQNISGRPTCFCCFRPYTHCLCDLVKPFAAHCNVLILQHPHERKKYYSTAKLVTNTLTNARLMRSIEFDPENLPDPADSKNKTYLLYPSSKAIDCEEASLDSKTTVIVIDGTWIEARKIMRRNPILQQYEHLTFKKALRSNYTIRKQPKDHYLSTLESIAHFLKLNSLSAKNFPVTQNYDLLFTLFNKMVTQQLSYFPRMQRPQTEIQPLEALVI